MCASILFLRRRPATRPKVTFFIEQQHGRHERNLQRGFKGETDARSNSRNPLANRARADRLELSTEADALKASLKQLRADMLVSFKHAAMLNKSAPDSRIPIEEL
jgi:hypothetical protein